MRITFVFVSIVFAVSACSPSKEQVAANKADRVYDICSANEKESDSTLSAERVDSTCLCTRNVAEQQLLNGTRKEEFTNAWYASTKMYCQTVDTGAVDRAEKKQQRLGALEDKEAASPKATPIRFQSDERSQRSQNTQNNTRGRPSNLGLFERIEQGDYTWSKAFPWDDPIFGFGLALRRSVETACPGSINAIETINIEYFLGGLQGEEVIDVLRGRKSLDLEALMQRSVLDVAYAEAARLHVEQLVDSKGCNSTRTRRVTANLARMLAGQRPAYGRYAQQTSLVTEKLGPVQQKHAYDGQTAASITSPAAALLDKDYADAQQAGLTILECHYDKDPSDEWYEVQYYWGVGALANLGFIIPSFGESFQRAAQTRLDRVNGGRRYIHPFTTYGSPRLGCPAYEDDAIGHKRIYAPRKAVDPPTSTMPAPNAPDIKTTRMFTTYTYGEAPENFVPPIPDELPKNTLLIKMEKQGAGSLSSIEIHKFGYWSLPRTDMDYSSRPAEQALLREDVSAISRQKPYVIVCKYLSTNRGITNVARYWYKDLPSGIERDRLSDRISDHPVLVIRGERDTCPAAYVEP